MEVSIVAEIGSNFAKFEDPDENLECAFEQMMAAKNCGATAVKFQYFQPYDLFGHDIDDEKGKILASFVPRLTDIPKLADVANSLKIEFMCSAFSVLGYEYVDQYVSRHKLASPEYTDDNLRGYLRSCNKPVIYSLGCHAGKVRNYYGHAEDVYLECVSEYPAYFVDYDLHRMVDIPNWGVSDHTLNNNLAIMARTLGATFFEKHVDFFYGEGRDTPDNCVSITAEEFVEYIGAINSVEPIDKDAIKVKAAKKHARFKQEHSDEFKRPMPEGWKKGV